MVSDQPICPSMVGEKFQPPIPSTRPTAFAASRIEVIPVSQTVSVWIDRSRSSFQPSVPPPYRRIFVRDKSQFPELAKSKQAGMVSSVQNLLSCHRFHSRILEVVQKMRAKLIKGKILVHVADFVNNLSDGINIDEFPDVIESDQRGIPFLDVPIRPGNRMQLFPGSIPSQGRVPEHRSVVAHGNNLRRRIRYPWLCCRYFRQGAYSYYFHYRSLLWTGFPYCRFISPLALCEPQKAVSENVGSIIEVGQ